MYRKFELIVRNSGLASTVQAYCISSRKSTGRNLLKATVENDIPVISALSTSDWRDRCLRSDASKHARRDRPPQKAGALRVGSDAEPVLWARSTTNRWFPLYMQQSNNGPVAKQHGAAAQVYPARYRPDRDRVDDWRHGHVGRRGSVLS